MAKWPRSPLQAKPKGEMNSVDNQSPLNVLRPSWLFSATFLLAPHGHKKWAQM